MSARTVLLVRHTEVVVRWANRCYGHQDVGLSRAGRRYACHVAARIATEPVTALIHSGLRRARFLAAWVSSMKGIVPIVDPRWRERNFGAWEGKSWQTIWRETGNAMDGMFKDPAGYRPGGGETTAELASRTREAWDALPPGHGVIVVVTHSGPIAALRTMLAGAPLSEIVNYTVHTGAIVSLPG